MAAAQNESHHHLRGNGLDPHAEHVAVPAGDAGGDRAGVDRGGQGGRGDRAPARARPERRRPDAGPGALPPVRHEDQGGERRGAQLHHRRRGHDDDRGAPAAALQLKPEVASLNMGSMNFGLYELARYKSSSIPGSGRISRAPTTASSRTRSRTSPTSCKAAPRTRHVSKSSATTSAISTPQRIFSTGVCSSHRSSFNRSSASAAASARTPRTCCT